MIRPCLEGGGATLSLLNLAGGLTKKGYQVTIAASGGLWLSKASEADLPIHQVALAPSTPLHLILAARQLRQIIPRHQVDLIHSHHRFASLASRIAAWGLNIPLVTTTHEYTTNFRHLPRLGTGNEVITFSQALKDHLTHHYRLPSPKITVVTMGVGQPGKPVMSLAESLSNHSTLLNWPSIGCIARLSPEKGVEILLQALARTINTTHHRPHCYIVGDGPQLRKLRTQAKRLNMSDFVTFLGWQDNLKNLIVQFDFLVLPSLHEGFGLAVLEGWMQERPTIGSQVGGIAELIKDGKNGLLVPPGDSNALARAILHLLENPSLARKMGKNGRLETLPNFTIEKMTQETENIYIRLREK